MDNELRFGPSWKLGDDFLFTMLFGVQHQQGVHLDKDYAVGPSGHISLLLYPQERLSGRLSVKGTEYLAGDDDTGASFRAGLRYTLNKEWAIRAEFEQLEERAGSRNESSLNLDFFW